MIEIGNSNIGKTRIEISKLVVIPDDPISERLFAVLWQAIQILLADPDNMLVDMGNHSDLTRKSDDA